MGRRNTLVFSQRWSNQNEVSSTDIFHGQVEVGDLGPLSAMLSIACRAVEDNVEGR
jgi:hypothetical protein